jgi:Ca2+-binding EF-hand superfamily protein
MAWAQQTQRQSGAEYEGMQHSDEQLISMFRDMLAQRGARGIFGMQRIFKIMDDNNSGMLDIQEFWKGMCDFRLAISKEECRELFDIFDADGSGEIDFNELMYAIAPDLNQFRKELVMRAFKKLDRDGSGAVDINDLKGVYNAKMHPEVKQGHKTEQEVLAEFLDTFEIHCGTIDKRKRDGSISTQEFCEYYRKLGSSIDDDAYFELMMTNAWNLDNKSYNKGWGGQY